MKVKFLTDEFKLLYQTGSSKKYKTVPMQVAKKLVRAVDVLSAATVIQDVWKFPSYNFEHLEGNKRYSMRMDRTCVNAGEKFPDFAGLKFPLSGKKIY